MLLARGAQLRGRELEHPAGALVEGAARHAGAALQRNRFKGRDVRPPVPDGFQEAGLQLA